MQGSPSHIQMSSKPSADLINTKLSSLNETQEGITSVGQCTITVLGTKVTHDRGPLPPKKRRSDRPAMAQVHQGWIGKPKAQPRLPRQRSRTTIKGQEAAGIHRGLFSRTYSLQSRSQSVCNRRKVLPEALENAYRHATKEVRQKIKRVVDVWKQRSVFPLDVIERINGRLDGKNL